MRFFTNSLMRQMITMFAVSSLVPLVIITMLSVHYSRDALRTCALDKLMTSRVIKGKDIRQFLKDQIMDLEILSHSSGIKDAFSLLKYYHDNGGGSPDTNYNVTDARYKRIYDEIDPFFRHYTETYGYYDIFFICAPHGHVMYTMAKEADLGENLKLGKLRNSGLAQIWQKVVSTGKSSMVDFAPYAPSNDMPAAFIGTPVFNDNGNIYAVIALQISAAQINNIIQEEAGMGKTGETYLVGEDYLMRSDLRLSKEPTFLNPSHKVDTIASQNALADRSGSGIIINHKGKEVLSSYSHLMLDENFGFDFEWAIIAEIEKAEALEAVSALTKRIIAIGFILIVCTCLLGYFSSVSISRPLTSLSRKISEIAKGNLTVEVEDDKRANEIGILTRAAQTMLASLRKQTSTMNDSAGSIAVSINELSAAASQLAASSTEASTTITEVTSTAEEVRHTAHASNEKAEEVTRLSSEMQGAAEKGHDCTIDTINGMQSIKKEMQYVANSIVKLSEQTMSIGEIISAVNDLSDQSNLLSVNAAIEAAKAGEYGKGFAVVAQKIMSLADQSKEATSQVKTILNDIQKATSAAVQATERGSKAVEDGEKLSETAGEAISSLANQVAEASQAATQIFASNQQQLEGMDQLASAMENIKDAAMQNTDGANQLKNATTTLNNLGQTMQMMAKQFQL